MNGVLQQSPRAKGNPALEAIPKQVEAQVPEALKDEFLSVMVAGQKLMWAPELLKERQAFDRLIRQTQDVPRVVAHTVLKVVSLIQNESGQNDILSAIGLAAPIFMAHVLQYVETKLGVPVTNEMIDQTAQLIAKNLLDLYGIAPEQVRNLAERQRVAEPSPEAPMPQGEA